MGRGVSPIRARIEALLLEWFDHAVIDRDGGWPSWRVVAVHLALFLLVCAGVALVKAAL